MKLLNSILAAITITIGLSGCSTGTDNSKAEQASPSAATKTEKVKIITLASQVIGKTIEYTSTLKPFEEVNMVPTAPGRIDNIFVEIGNRVKKGDVLVQMDQTQLIQAQIQLKNLKLDYDRFDTLQKVGSITRQQFDQISTQYEVALSNIAFLKENTRLIAPFDGIISGKYYEDGEMYSGTPMASGKAAILTLVQINPLKAMVNVPETYYPLIREGMKTRVVCDIYSEQPYMGEIIRVHPTIDVNTHSFTVEIQVPNQHEKLKPGMFVRVDLKLGEVKALVVPALAVLKLQGSNERFVFLEEGGIAKRVSVTLGQRFDDMVEVISPELTEGSHLIIAGQARLVDKIPVEIVSE
jgi:membrane fusion protein, multidrug efflux system